MFDEPTDEYPNDLLTTKDLFNMEYKGSKKLRFIAYPIYVMKTLFQCIRDSI